jgi:hypothetical protein
MSAIEKLSNLGIFHNQRVLGSVPRPQIGEVGCQGVDH